MKTLYVSDMDGTLLNSDSVVPRGAVEDINKAIGAGALFTVATARTPATLAGLLKEIRLSLPAVVMTGATTWNPADNTYHDTCHFSPDTAAKVLEIYSFHRLPTFLYTLRHDMIDIFHLGPLSELEMDFIRNRLNSPYKRFHLTPAQQRCLLGNICSLSRGEAGDIWKESLANLPSSVADGVLFFAMQPATAGEPVVEDLQTLADINPMFYFDTVYPGMAMIEAFPAGASKANAVKRLAERLGADRIVAFGDNRNDLPLLRAADLSVAVENAIPLVKEEADVIIGNCDSGAVGKFILEDYLAHLANGDTDKS